MPQSRLLADQSLHAADAFLRVPQDTLLHVGAAQRDPVYGLLFSQLELQAHAEMDARYMLCLLLILERAKGSKSAWAPYIDFLPTAYGRPSQYVHSIGSLCKQMWLRASIAIKGLPDRI